MTVRFVPYAKVRILWYQIKSCKCRSPTLGQRGVLVRLSLGSKAKLALWLFSLEIPTPTQSEIDLQRDR